MTKQNDTPMEDFGEPDAPYGFGHRALTEQQAAFVLHYTSTPEAIGNAAEAARRAGYSEKSAREIGRQLLDKPHVRKAVDQANRRAISGKLATKAVALLERTIDDEKAPIKVRVEAAKTVLDRAGFTAADADGDDDEMPLYRQKNLSEMSREELEEIIRMGAEVLKNAKESGAVQ